MPIDAIATRRVAQTLQSIGDYLEEGARIARQIKPGQSVQLTLEPITRTPGPLVVQALWDDTDGHVIELGTGSSTVDILIEGENLLTVSEVTLVAAPSPSKFFETEDIITPTATAVTARITLLNPPAVTYHLKVTTIDAQTFLLRDALAIERPPDDDDEDDDDDDAVPDLELGTLVPAELRSGTVRAQLILLRGSAADLAAVHVTTRDGVRVGGPPVEIDLPAVPAVHNASPGSQDIRDVDLRMKLPRVTEPTIYCLVASTKDGAEDRIAFTVKPRAPRVEKGAATKRAGQKRKG